MKKISLAIALLLLTLFAFPSDATEETQWPDEPYTMNEYAIALGVIYSMFHGDIDPAEIECHATAMSELLETLSDENGEVSRFTLTYITGLRILHMQRVPFESVCPVAVES